MTSLKDIIVEKIHFNRVFQNRVARKYFDNPQSHFNDLREDEKYTKIKIVYNRANKTEQYIEMLSHIHISFSAEHRFQSWIDTGLYVERFYGMPDNVPPYYPIILDSSLNELANKYDRQKSEYYKQQVALLKAIISYVHRIENELDNAISNYPEKTNLKKTRKYFSRMIDNKAETFEEALQRILFWSSLFWQSQHRLVGLGRLDKILEKYDIAGENEIELIKDFYQEMHRYYAFKSSATSLGDTGQIVILGGVESDGSYFTNHLTYSFIKAIEICHLPDPKILLRVSGKTPDDLIQLAVKCISTGIGCPLLANDDVIIPAIKKFGYENDDAHNYVTSACWEPLVYGNSLEKNNIKIINFAEPLTQLIAQDNFTSIVSFDDLLSRYLERLINYIDMIIESLKEVKWEKDPLASLLTVGCFDSGKDVSEGGAKYSDYGILSVGMTNVINSLFNVEKLAFENHKYTLGQLKNAAVNNYVGYEETQSVLRAGGYFGIDEGRIIDVVNKITSCVEQRLSSFTNKFGGKVKFGLSASNYVEIAANTAATLDGRKASEALRAHITSTGDVTYTQLFNFASALDYEGIKANGNVVDFFVSPFFIQNNFEKFCLFIKNAIKNGFFEMQMNVVCSATLIDAKNHPENYPNLIVRVWGFSAYFKDLPEEYQNVLIERAIQSERAG